MKPNKLELIDFKCFGNLSLPLASVTVLTGVNSGGKTSIIQALLIAFWYNSTVGPGKTSWPADGVQGITFGDPISCIRFGTDEANINLTFNNIQTSLTLNQDGVCGETLQNDNFSNYRIVPASSLPNKSIHLLPKRNTANDKFLGNADALFSLHENAIRRIEGGLEPNEFLGSLVEAELSTITTNTRIRTFRINDNTLDLAYSGTQVEDDFVSPEHYGAGITAVLPLIVHLCEAKSGETIIVQDPEKHLHPRGQSMIGRLMARASLNNVQIVIETHSEHVLAGLKIGLLEAQASINEKLACFYFDSSEEVMVKQIVFDNRGRTKAWPMGYFDQASVDFRTLITLNQ